jgi:hypothetical protein
MESVTPPPAPPDGLAVDPSWFPFLLDLASDTLLLVATDEAAFRAASFLDQRSLAPGAERRSLPWQAAADAMGASTRRDGDYIFHIGHVGSTLLSRLLGELPSVLALREPLLLRSFAEALTQRRWPADEEPQRLGTLNALLSRSFRPAQRALVKATSFTSEIADRLVPAGSRALFLHVAPRAYVETILGGDASRQELAMLTPSRIARLAARCPGLVLDESRLSEAQKAVVAWACEMVSLERAGAALGRERVLWLDFDAFLARPAEQLAAAAAFLGHEMPAADAEALAADPLMRRYSKAPEYEYTAGLRREVLADARRRFGGDIDAALAGLAAMGQRWPAIAQVLERSRGV